MKIYSSNLIIVLTGYFSPHLGKSINRPHLKILNVSWDLCCYSMGNLGQGSSVLALIGPGNSSSWGPLCALQSVQQHPWPPPTLDVSSTL